MSVVEWLVRRSPRRRPPASLREASRFLDRDPRRLAAVTDATGLAVGCAAGLVAVVLGAPELLLAAAGAGWGASAGVRGVIAVATNVRRSRAVGAAPTVVSRAVLRARVAPTAEGAAAFAAETDGLLGDRLAEHVRRARGTPRSGLGSFAADWRDAFPAIHRAVTLVDAAVDAPTAERDRTLDRAMDAILEGTRERAAEAADAMHGPATAIYAFGVLLPLALVGVVPAAGAAGVEATLAAVVVCYDLVLPVGLCCASAWLLSTRPVAFPAAPVGAEAGRDGALAATAAGLAGGLGAAAIAAAALPTWAAPVAAAGVGSGVALVVHHRPIVAVRRRADELDAALPDALYLVGRRVADGIALERTVAEAADELDGVARETVGAAARRQRQLHVGVETAFVGEHGALDGVPSERAESAARLLGVAARTGAPAGRALVETADHLDALRRVELEARRDLGRVTSTLANTAAFFGPLVGGATVALAGAVGTTGALEGSAPDSAGLGVAVGVYVLLLAAILTALSTGLARGLDRATLGYRVGMALCSATATYLLAFAAAATVAGGL